MTALKAHDQSAILGTFIPSGVMMPFAGATSPSGWLLCDGSSISQTVYAALYAAIATAWGNPGGGSFNLPDLRGRFMRGRDGGIARDPDRATRTACAAGGNTGDAVGSVQAEATKKNGLAVSGGTASLTGNVAGGTASLTGAISSTAASNGTLGVSHTAASNGTLGVAYTAQLLSGSPALTGAIAGGSISDPGHAHNTLLPSVGSAGSLAGVSGGNGVPANNGNSYLGVQSNTTGITHTAANIGTLAAGIGTLAISAGAASISGAIAGGSASLTGAVSGGTATNGNLAVSNTAANNGTLAVSNTPAAIGAGDNETRSINANVNYIIKY